MAAAVASSVSSSETGVAAEVELELSPPLDEAMVVSHRPEKKGRRHTGSKLLYPMMRIR